MTRTNKANNRDHVGLANGTAAPEEHLPRYFAKSGHDGINPSSTKKQGQGRGNWYVLQSSKSSSAPSSTQHMSTSSSLHLTSSSLSHHSIPFELRLTCFGMQGHSRLHRARRPPIQPHQQAKASLQLHVHGRWSQPLQDQVRGG